MYYCVFSEQTCELCPAGKYSTLNATVCTECGVGKYSTATGASACVACPANSQPATAAGASSCLCNAGFRLDAGTATIHISSG